MLRKRLRSTGPLRGPEVALRRVDRMNRLPRDLQVRVIACLVDGVSVRHRTHDRGDETHHLRLRLDVGEGCARLHDRLMRDLRCAALQLDEQHSIVCKRTRNMLPTDGDDVGEQWA